MMTYDPNWVYLPVTATSLVRISILWDKSEQEGKGGRDKEHQGLFFSECLTGEESSASETRQMAMLEGNFVLGSSSVLYTLYSALLCYLMYIFETVCVYMCVCVCVCAQRLCRTCDNTQGCSVSIETIVFLPISFLLPSPFLSSLRSICSLT